ncbi:hypothetical protein AX17_001216 [Amanita inopinata Kibby_2008]|nr:hypothetical protein AX17_001216 [Amanita inopinata Kibby_2008]
MPLGEEPITSYFPSTGSLNKRKHYYNRTPTSSTAHRPSQQETGNVSACKSSNDGIQGLSKKRSRKATASSISSASSSTPPPVSDLFRTKGRKLKKPRTDRDPQLNQSSSIISLDDDGSDDVLTRSPRIGSSEATGSKLQTLSPERLRGPRRDKENKSQHRGTHSRPRESLANSHASCGIPSTFVSPGRCKIITERSKLTRNCSASGTDLSKRTTIHNIISDSESDVEILSSRVLEGHKKDLPHPFNSALPSPQISTNKKFLRKRTPEARDAHESDMFSVLESSKAQVMLAHADDSKPSVSSSDNSDVLVPSSQTQQVLLNYVSPQRARLGRRFLHTSRRSLPDGEVIDDTVPSSQSQYEISLTHTQRAQENTGKVPKRVNDLSSSSSYRERGIASSRPPNRTLSDELFSIPVQQMNLGDFFMDYTALQQDEGPEKESPMQPEGDVVDTGSATESDSDGEMLDTHNKSSPRRQPSKPSQSQILASTQTWGSGDEADASDDNYSSLPNAKLAAAAKNPKVALITGAGSGIGRESCLLFAQEGAHVILVDVNLEGAQKGAALIAERYPNVRSLAIKADVGNEEDIKIVVDLAVKEFGRLDVMFNNAGVMHPEDDNALNTEERIWDLTMQINLKGVWWGCKYAIQAMRNNPTDETRGLHTGGSIINTASFVALMGAATPQLAYTASKGAVLAMTRELAIVHAREGIRINSLCPGPLKTPLLMDFLNTPEKRERRLVHLPMGRFGEAVELAKAALFLASDDSSYVTGTDFKVDGGLSSAYVTAIGEPVLPPPASLV